MSSAVLRRSRRVRAPSRARSPSAASPSRSPSSSLVIADVLAGRDVLAKSPTGSGKTLAFGVPIVDRIEADDRRPAALVLAPDPRARHARSSTSSAPLAHARALTIAAVYGGVGIDKQAARGRAARTSSSPRPAASRTCSQRGDVHARRTSSILVLDEADRMLDMGFRPAVDRIVGPVPARAPDAVLLGHARRRGRPRRRRATRATPRRHEHAPPRRARRRRSSTASSPSSASDTRRRARRASCARERDLALVFVRTKRGADRLVKRLGREGVDAVAMHGDKSQGQRERALAQLRGAASVDTLVATDVAARGIDVDGISHVINFDPPEDRDGYVHRIGRTGRAGRTGVGITFVGAEQARDVERIAAELRLRPRVRGDRAQHARRGRGRAAASGSGNGGGRQRSRRR